jgi:hypothetical protein
MNIRPGSRERIWSFVNSPLAIAWLMRDGSSLLQAGGPVAPLDQIWAVRRDWRDGAHELICPRRDAHRARKALESDAQFWRRGPVRPRLSVVRLTLAEFRSHPDWCRSSACPTEVCADVTVRR